MNERISEKNSIEKFKEDPQEQLEKIKIEVYRKSKVRKEQNYFKINRDISANISKLSKFNYYPYDKNSKKHSYLCISS